MKKKFILLPLVGIFLYFTLSSYWYGPAVAGLGNRTGATGVLGCGGVGCHAGAPTPSTSVTVQLLSGGSPVTSYIPGNVYTLKITGTNTGSTSLPNFGFQLCVVNASGAGTGGATYAGNMSSTPSSTHIYTTGGAQIFEHYSAAFGDGSIPATTGTGGTGSTYVTSVTWTAPSAGTGSVIIYGVLNAVNHNASADAGDLWNTASPVTICEQSSPITGTLSVCATATTTLSDVTTGGTWSSLSPSIATVGSSSGIVTGVAFGTATINYTTACGTVSAVVTVNPLPSNITGVPVVCTGLTTTLSDGTPGGTWSSVTPSVASISGSGTSATVTGVALGGGTSLISYTLTGTGCVASTTVTVNPAPAAISGTTSLCQGTSTTLTDGLTGGTWSSGTPGVATIGSSSGLLTAVNTGSTSPATSVITYTSSAGCSVTTTVTVNPLPLPISGTATVCPGFSSTLSDAGGGTWTSGTLSVATVGSGSGVVTGVLSTGGTSVITYALPGTGCSTTKTVTVNPAPAAISGTTEICPGNTTTLSDAGGGTWSSASPGVATVGSSSGIVTGVFALGGTSVITYTLPVTGCAATTTVTVDPAPSAISGTMSVCAGATTALTDAGGGAWSSSAVGVGSIDGTGIVTGITPGTTTITYTLPVTGCTATSIVTVNSLPAVAAITGTMNVCAGSTTTLSDATPGGAWSSSSGVATVGTSGVVTGVSAGFPTISYSVTNGSGCTTVVTAPVTVNATPPAIGGPNHVCTASTITLTESSSGTWTSGTPGIATVTSPGAATTLSGVAAGTSVITYTLPSTGCTAMATITVNQTPNAITGTPTVCIGQTTTLGDLLAGGTWTSSSTHASVGGTAGIVTGVTSGTATISYTMATGCFATKIVTVNSLPAAISGPTQVCISANITLIDAGGGSWSSSNTNATVGAGTGVVTGVTAGTSVITYTLAGCYTTWPITINALPSAISGPSSVCVGQTITVTDPDPGSWSSSGTGTATAGSGTGIVTGIAPGSVNIIFTKTGTGCTITHPVTVNALSAISGLTSLCAGTTTTLTDATAGGTWSSSNTAAATIGTSSGLLSALAPGTTTISYTLPSGCIATSAVNVISAPSSISGPGTVCIGSTITLTDAGGGTWTSSAPGVATIGSSTGIVTPVTTGTTTVTYSLGTGCTVNMVITVNAAASAISGPSAVCVGSTISLTDAGGGTWSSSNTNASVGTTGVVTGVTAGNSVITYTIGSGCYATKPVTVNPLPATISGTLSVCVGASTTLTDGTPGGSWTSLNVPVATIGSASGLVTGVTSGVANIKYTITATGCNTTVPVTVNANPSAITGTATVCTGSTTTLTDGGGGTWTSSNANATVDPTGLVTGVSSGTSVITYTLGSGCFATRTVTVNPLPAAIGGALTVCAGSTTTLTDGTGGGSWSSSSPSFATIGSGSGIVTGVSGGASVIFYTLTGTGCAQSVTVTVNPLPGIISGTTAICIGGTSTLTDAGGGTWSSSLPSIATIGSSTGLVTTIAAGTTVISYALPVTGCIRTATVTVNPLPSPISGPDSVCTGATVTLTDGGGGTWISSATSIATIGSSTGVVTGVAIGSSVITYTLSTGCTSTVTVTVHVSPSSITGTASVCAGSTTTLSDGTGGGTWSSSAPATATVGSAGIVSGLVSGTATISYTISSGCSATSVVTVNPLPSAISGISVVCPAATITLTDGGGGSWTSSNIAIATIGSSTGIVAGVAAGTATITYTLATGCMAIMPITVNPLPFAGGITGPSTVCADSVITLADTASGGVWSSVFTSRATVGTTGIVTGVSAGVDTIKYAVTNSCGTATVTKAITINPLPVAGTVTGVASVCFGSSITLADTASGGTWSSSNTSVATIGASTGVITTVAAGVTTITYSVTNGCGTASATKIDSVLALPTVDPIAGADSVCEGDTLRLSDLISGGAWSVTNANATVDITGLITGITAGTDSVIYTVTNSCGSVSAGILLNIRSHAICNSGVKPLPELASGFKVYPNPSTGIFIVDMPETPVGSTIVITDVLGKTVETRYLADTQPQKVTFDLSHIAAGSYILKVNAGNTTYRQKIVIW